MTSPPPPANAIPNGLARIERCIGSDDPDFLALAQAFMGLGMAAEAAQCHSWGLLPPAEEVWRPAMLRWRQRLGAADPLNPAAGPFLSERKEAVMGDLRLSIGNFQGKPTAVVYRKVAAAKNPKTFSSGVIAEYPMDSVVVLTEAKVDVKVDAKGKRYVVEAAIPLASLGLKPADAVTLRGDFGATHGDKAGMDTVLRTHWSNQATGLVSDEVYELMMEPASWGELRFEE